MTTKEKTQELTEEIKALQAILDSDTAKPEEKYLAEIFKAAKMKEINDLLMKGFENGENN